MNLKSGRSLLLVAGAGLIFAGCTKREDPVTAESAKQRLENQARAVAALSAENDRLRAEIAELKRENASLRRSLELVKKVLKKYSAAPGGAGGPEVAGEGAAGALPPER